MEHAIKNKKVPYTIPRPLPFKWCTN